MHSFVSCLLHCVFCVFSTKERKRWLTSDIHKSLHPYLAGICRNNSMKQLVAGGVEDHIHVLISIPSTMSTAKAIQLLKGNSSKWIHETFPEMKAFEWQEGYGAFSIGMSGIEATSKYIDVQIEHHKKVSFKSELKAILRKHDLEFQEWMLD